LVMQRTGLTAFCLIWLAAMMAPALAGPPYQSDDPEPTDFKHFEIYTFVDGTTGHDGTSGESGIDFNYGAAPNLQLTAVIPAAYNFGSGAAEAGFGNIELAAKYRFLTQDLAGVDVAFFPRVFLPAGSSAVGTQHASLFLPLWLEKDWGQWSAFGGGGCELNRGGNDQNFCQVGAVIARQVVSNLQLGLEIFHQMPDTLDGEATTSVGAGARYDVTDNVHLLGYLARNIQNADETERYNWYASILFTF
jgi:opacity protein-like surface antigen